jgi:peptide/nickel transport system permease protein
MAAYIARRVMLGALTVVIISIVSFMIIQLPEGDFVDEQIRRWEEQGTGTSLAQAQYLREFYGLDKPMLVQYWKWVSQLMAQDFGQSLSSDENVSTQEILSERLVTTMALGAFTILLTWLLAIPIGIYSAVRQHSIGDYVFTFLGFTGLAVPDFLLGLVLMYIAFAYFDESVGGLFSGEFIDAPWSLARFWDLLKHLWIPAIVLGTAGTAGLIRVMRNNLLDQLDKPYVVTARAKGQVNWKLIIKYPVRVALNPFISGIGSLLPALISGSVIVSIVLSLPTLGPVLLNALLTQDIYVAATILLLLGSLTVVGTLISDLVLVLVDPRIRFGERGAYH